MSLNDFDKSSWKNWAENQSVTPWKHCRPQSLGDLVGFVQEAEQNGKRVRAVGSGWSFPDVAITPGYLLETTQLNKILNTVNPAALSKAAQGHTLFHVEAGITIHNLNAILDPNWALPTMGGADGQTLAGAISTCVHGADLHWGPLPEMVRAIHLVGAGGIQYWIEPTQGLTDPARLQQALSIDPANIHYDDVWFNSVLVSVGSMGIIYSFLIEVQPQFDLEATTTQDTWNNMRQLLMGEKLFSPSNRCVQVAIDPNLVNGQHACYLTIRQQAPATQPHVPPQDATSLAMGWLCDKLVLAAIFTMAPPLLETVRPYLPLELRALPPGLLEAALGVVQTATAAILLQGPTVVGDVLGTLLNGNPGLAAQVTSALTKSSLPLGTVRGWSHTVLAPSSQCIARGLSIEMAFDTSNGSHIAFTDEALQILETELQKGMALGGWYSLRFVGRSRAYLSPQRFARTCMIEITGLRTLKGTGEILNLLELAGKKHAGIQHWGQFSVPNLSQADVVKTYPDLNKWQAVRWQITNEGRLNTFDSDFSVRCGLWSAEPAGPQITWDGLQGERLRPIPVLGKNADGRQQVFALTVDGQLHTCSETTPGGPWQAWSSLDGNQLAGPIAVANNADGRLQVFVRGGDSVIYYRAQRAPNGVWDDWSALGGGAVKSFSVGANQDGRLEVVAVWVDGASYHIWQTSPNGNWSGWETLGGWQLQGPVALGRNADGRLEAFVVGGDGVVYHQRQTQVGQDPWNGWATLGDPSVPAVVDVAVAAGVHGRLFLFLMRLDQALSYRAQIGPNGDWGAPVHLHGHDRLWPLVVGHNPDGRLDVFVVGRDGQIHNRKQSHRATPDLWSDWAMLGGSQLQVGIGIGSNSSQELELYVIGGDQRLYRGHRAVDEETLAVRVQITNMLDHIPATNQQMSLMSIYPKVTVAQNGLQLTDAANGIFDGVTVLQDTIPIHMEIWRTFKKVFGKPIQDDKKGWMVDWGPAIGIQPMPSKWQVDANGDPYPAEVLAKLHPTYPAPDGFDSSTAARSLVLAYSHDLGVISGDVSGKPATKIHVPGVGSSSIEFDLAISER